MGSSDSPCLSALQQELLVAFFDRTDLFFLTGGAALAGFDLKHRDTKDLDLSATATVDIHEGIDAGIGLKSVCATGSASRMSSRPS